MSREEIGNKSSFKKTLEGWTHLNGRGANLRTTKKQGGNEVMI